MSEHPLHPLHPCCKDVSEQRKRKQRVAGGQLSYGVGGLWMKPPKGVWRSTCGEIEYERAGVGERISNGVDEQLASDAMAGTLRDGEARA